MAIFNMLNFVNKLISHDQILIKKFFSRWRNEPSQRHQPKMGATNDPTYQRLHEQYKHWRKRHRPSKPFFQQSAKWSWKQQKFWHSVGQMRAVLHYASMNYLTSNNNYTINVDYIFFSKANTSGHRNMHLFDRAAHRRWRTLPKSWPKTSGHCSSIPAQLRSTEHRHGWFQLGQPTRRSLSA